MRSPSNPGRVVGLWYLLLVFLGPLRLIYIPNKLFDFDNPALTANNLVAHETLFRFGMASDVVCAILLIIVTLSFYRLFQHIDRSLAALVVILGGVMSALLYFVNIVSDAGALIVARAPAFLAVFSQPQREALVVLLLRLHSQQNTAAETLWGAWLIPLAILVYRSRMLPRFLGIWLALNGVAYIAISFIGLLAPAYQSKAFLYAQPALFAELALTLWLVIMGSKAPETYQERHSQNAKSRIL